MISFESEKTQLPSSPSIVLDLSPIKSESINASIFDVDDKESKKICDLEKEVKGDVKFAEL